MVWENNSTFVTAIFQNSYFPPRNSYLRKLQLSWPNQKAIWFVFWGGQGAWGYLRLRRIARLQSPSRERVVVAGSGIIIRVMEPVSV